LLARIESPGFRYPEQWQPQIQALVQRNAEVLVHSSIPEEVLRAVHLKRCDDISACVRSRLASLGDQARVAALPYGPLTIPYIGK
jgi:lactate racemase